MKSYKVGSDPAKEAYTFACVLQNTSLFPPPLGLLSEYWQIG